MDPIDRQAAIDVVLSEPLYESGMKKRGADAVVPVIYEKIKSLPSLHHLCYGCKHKEDQNKTAYWKVSCY